MTETQPKQWLPSEIWQLMAEEMKAYKHDCALRRRPFSYDEMAENVYHVLSEKGLIEHAP
jgi:hypothetical protein